MVDKSEITAAAGRLRHQLDAVKDHQRSVWLGEGMGLLVSVLVPALGFAMVADNLAHLHVAVRLLILAGLVAATVALVRLAARLLRRPLTAEMIAVKVERTFPEIDNRLINSLLLANEDDPQVFQLIRSVIESGNADATKRDLRGAVPKRRMRLLALSSTLAVVLMAVYAAAFPNHFVNALARVLVPFASPPPLTRTKILAVSPKDHNLLSGDNVTIAAELGGRLPDTAEVLYEPDGDEMQAAIMRPGAEPNRFGCLMADVTKTFTYRVVAGDARSPQYRVTVHHRPVIEKLELRITPPSYTGLPAISQPSGTVKALAGSTVEIRATCSKPIAKAALAVGNTDAKPMATEGSAHTTVAGSFRITQNTVYRILLTDTFGFANKPAEHDVELIIDEPPEIKLLAPPPTSVVKPGAALPFQFTVTDRYGVRSVEIVHVTKDDQEKPHDRPLESYTAPDHTHKTVAARDLGGGADAFVLPVSRLGLRPGGSAVLQVVARDWNDVTGPGVTRSRQAVVTVMLPKEATAQSREALRKAALELAQIIQKQRRNIGLGRVLLAKEVRQAGAIVGDPAPLHDSIALQEEVRTGSGKLLALMDDKLPMKSVIRGLFESEMIQAVQRLRAVPADKKPANALQAALDTEHEILARLTGRSEQLRRTVETAGLRDIFAALEELVRQQKLLRADTQTGAAAKLPNKPLADRQDRLAGKTVAFKELLVDNGRSVAQSDQQLAKRFDEAAKMVESRQIRQSMILAATKLAKGALAEAIPIQDKVLADLAAIAKFLREPVAASAARKLHDLKELVEEGKDKADRMRKLQAAIKEISEELERSKDLRGDKAQEAAKVADELKDLEEKLADAAEQLAKDLSLFPDIPAANEMVEEMREVFEDIEQAPGSENKEVQEIGVDRDEGALAAMDKVKERFADMEMWMMDKPDAERWKQEGWDVDEMPDIPLVDLPEELEDLVGDLVDQADDLNEQAQDSTSNLTLPDFPAGWDVADGPMDSFGAKGKSGNERPNENEMMGRSGAGREGNANGEIVGQKAKDLEGTETKARRTHDPFAEGVVEEENPKSKAKATGGGKQSGVGGEGGLRGSAAARNELAMRELARRQRKLKRDTESVYSKATLMYLPTGELDQAVVLMHKAEQQARAGDWAGFGETQKRIAHALRNTKRKLQGKGAVQMDPLRKLPADIKEQMFDARDEPIPPEFERLVAEYYKAIAAGAVK